MLSHQQQGCLVRFSTSLNGIRYPRWWQLVASSSVSASPSSSSAPSAAGLGAATAAAFERKFNIVWPSIIDSNNGSVLMAFTGVVTPQAVPTTLVIDGKGRVSARVLGRIEKGTLKALIKTAVSETK